MNISKFTKGNIITRNEKSNPGKTFSGFDGDRSYMGDRMKFLGYSDKVIYLEHEQHGVITLAGDEWLEGWTKYRDDFVDRVSKDTHP